MYEDLKKILITKEEIDKRIKELAAELDRDYEGKRPLMVAILKGSVMFFADLVRAMTIPLEMDFMAISSYGNKTKSSGEVRMIKDLDRSIEGKHLVIVEDIVDSGYTLSFLKRMLYSRHPESVKICTLLDKRFVVFCDLSVSFSVFHDLSSIPFPVFAEEPHISDSLQ